VDRIRPHFTGYGQALDYEWLATAVLRVVKRRMPDEYEKIKATISKEVRRIWP
jgi:uncharacterized protein (DUF2267 family)